jgi:hypothetical protein
MDSEFGCDTPVCVLLTVQDLRAQALGYTAASNPYYHIRRRFQKLYSDFKPNKSYWRLILIMRKLCLAGCTTLLKKFPAFQVWYLYRVLLRVRSL